MADATLPARTCRETAQVTCTASVSGSTAVASQQRSNVAARSSALPTAAADVAPSASGSGFAPTRRTCTSSTGATGRTPVSTAAPSSGDTRRATSPRCVRDAATRRSTSGAPGAAARAARTSATRSRSGPPSTRAAQVTQPGPGWAAIAKNGPSARAADSARAGASVHHAIVLQHVPFTALGPETRWPPSGVGCR